MNPINLWPQGQVGGYCFIKSNSSDDTSAILAAKIQKDFETNTFLQIFLHLCTTNPKNN